MQRQCLHNSARESPRFAKTWWSSVRTTQQAVHPASGTRPRRFGLFFSLWYWLPINVSVVQNACAIASDMVVLVSSSTDGGLWTRAAASAQRGRQHQRSSSSSTSSRSSNNRASCSRGRRERMLRFSRRPNPYYELSSKAYVCVLLRVFTATF